MADCPPGLDDARALDRADPLARFRARFALPEGVIYLDGNSLGPLPYATAARLAGVIAQEWGNGLIGSWNDHDWIGAPLRIGDKIAQIIGAGRGEVVVADSTSVNLYKLILAAAGLAPDRRSIVTEAGNFPTDLYVADGAARVLGYTLSAIPRHELPAAMDAGPALAVLTQVDYRSGDCHDMAAITARAARAGTRVVWDLSHSVGAVPLDLAADGVELAVGCGYKHLNGGPGAPAFLYVAKHLQDRLTTPIAGWLGHAAPFAFASDYAPAPSIARFQAGTPPMLSLLALEAGVDLMLEVDRAALFAKAARLSAFFLALMAAHCPEMTRVSPADAARRGGHVSFRHPDAYAIVQALIARGVIGDFRTPDIARFGITPLYTRFEDIWRAVNILRDILATGVWAEPRFAVRRAVT